MTDAFLQMPSHFEFLLFCRGAGVYHVYPASGLSGSVFCGCYCIFHVAERSGKGPEDQLLLTIPSLFDRRTAESDV